MKFDPQAAGNKGIPEPRLGYEQRLISYKKFNESAIKGWSVRKDGGEVHKGGLVLCERYVGGIPDAIPETSTDEVIHALLQITELVEAPEDSPVELVVKAIGEAAEKVIAEKQTKSRSKKK